MCCSCDAQVCVESCGVLNNLTITGAGDQLPVSPASSAVVVSNKGCVLRSMHMRNCTVDGAWRDAAVAADGGGKLVAVNSSMHNSESSGLLVFGGHAVLHRCKADDNACRGWHVDGHGSVLLASHSCANRNKLDNANVSDGGSAHIVHCSLDGGQTNGLCVSDYYVEDRSFVTVEDCSICDNAIRNVDARYGRGRVQLRRCWFTRRKRLGGGNALHFVPFFLASPRRKRGGHNRNGEWVNV